MVVAIGEKREKSRNAFPFFKTPIQASKTYVLCKCNTVKYIVTLKRLLNIRVQTIYICVVGASVLYKCNFDGAAL